MGKSHRICKVCDKPYYGQGKYCCSVECKNVYMTGKKLNISDSERKRRSESMTLKTKNKKLSEDHKCKIGNASKLRWKNKEYREKISKSHEGHVVTQETRDKISENQKGRKNPWTIEYNKNRIPPTGWHHTEESKQKIKEKVSGRNNGRYGLTPKNIKPIKFIDIHDRVFNMRSSWEVIFAKYLDRCGINWDYETKTYELSNGRTYTPDFFTENCIFEVKGLKYIDSMKKFESFKKEYPDINIVLVDRHYFEQELLIKL